METILTVKEESMIAVADAVRDKSGSTESLSFPNGMVAAINSIETTPVDLTGYATEEYVNDAISNIDFPEPDLTGYATETYVDEAIAAVGGGGGASDAASVSFDDTAAQIGVDNVQAAIEYLADEAANSTSVQEQIDTTIKDASQYLRRLGDNIYLSSNVSNASNYNWTNKKTCPNVGTQVLYWDLDDMEIQGCYTDSSKNFKKSNNFFFRLQKGHYYSTYYLEYDSFRNFYNEFGAYPLSEYYFGIAYNDPYVSYTVGHNPCALYCGASVAILFTDITYVYADAAVSEDRVSEMITEALGVIEDGTY